MGALAYQPKELAEMLGVSVQTVLNYAHRGIIPAKQPLGKRGRVIFPRKAVDAWLEEMGTDVRPKLKRAK